MQKAIFTDALIYGGVDFVWKFINFALFPLLAYLLSVEEFGVYTLLNVQTWLTVMVINCGLHVSLEKFYLAEGQDHSFKKGIVSASLSWLTFFGGIVTLVGLGVSAYFRASFENIPWTFFALALVTAWPMAVFHYLCNVCRVDFSPWKFAALHFLQNTLALSLGLGLIVFGGCGVEGLLWGALISFAALIPLAYVWVVHPLPLQLNPLLVKTALVFGIPFLFNDLARWSYGWLDRIWLEQFASLHDVGLFGMAFKLVTPLIFLITSFSLAWTPYALKHTESAFLSRSLALWISLLTFCALALSLFGQELLELLTPPAFWEAAPLIPPIAIGLVFLGSAQVTQVPLIQASQTKRIALLAWLGGLFSCLINFALIPRYGAFGSALAVLATYAFIGVGTLWLARKQFSEGAAGVICLLILCMGWWISDWSLLWKGGLLAAHAAGAVWLSPRRDDRGPERFHVFRFFKQFPEGKVDERVGCADR